MRCCICVCLMRQKCKITGGRTIPLNQTSMQQCAFLFQHQMGQFLHAVIQKCVVIQNMDYLHPLLVSCAQTSRSVSTHSTLEPHIARKATSAQFAIASPCWCFGAFIMQMCCFRCVCHCFRSEHFPFRSNVVATCRNLKCNRQRAKPSTSK